MAEWNDQQTDAATIIALLGQWVSVYVISDHLLSCLCHFPPLLQGSHVPRGNEDAHIPSSRSESWRESSSTTCMSARTDAFSCPASWVWQTGALPFLARLTSQKTQNRIKNSTLGRSCEGDFTHCYSTHSRCSSWGNSGIMPSCLHLKSCCYACLLVELKQGGRGQ